MTHAAIIDMVERYFDLEPQALLLRSRRRQLARPRQLAMYLCHQHTDDSFSGIGRAFNRKHTSVIHAVQNVNREMAATELYERDLKLLGVQIGRVGS